MSSFKKYAWTPEEDMKLVTYIRRYGIWNWSQMPKHAGLSRSGKSCRLRWMNYLNPQIKRGNYTAEEDDTIINMRGNIGVGWSAIAARLPGRTDNEIKNRWHTHLKKRSSNTWVKIIEPKMEEIIELEIDTTKNGCEYSSSSSPETHYEDFYQHKPTSSYILSSDNTSSNNNIVPPTYNQTSTDPHISFWTEPFSSENVYGDHHPTHVEQWPMPQDWFSPYDWCDSSWDYWFKLLAFGSLDDHQMVDSTVIY